VLQDAIILFNGTDLSGWLGEDGKRANWNVRDGFFETVGGAGAIHTERDFGDLQVHIEWTAPVPPVGAGQGRGNSGVFLMGLYEVQILDSYQNDTYPDGQVGAIYGQHPPLFNASRPPGEWQTFAIFFRRPRFDTKGALVSKARITVLHNGVLIQNNEELLGPTSWLQHLSYQKHPDKLPLMLQDHSNPVRFRNVWVRELPEEGIAPAAKSSGAVSKVDKQRVSRYTGTYTFPWGMQTAISVANGQLWLEIGPTHIPLVLRDSDTFALDGVDASVVFSTNASGGVTGYTLHVGSDQVNASRVAK